MLITRCSAVCMMNTYCSTLFTNLWMYPCYHLQESSSHHHLITLIILIIHIIHNDSDVLKWFKLWLHWAQPKNSAAAAAAAVIANRYAHLPLPSPPHHLHPHPLDDDNLIVLFCLELWYNIWWLHWRWAAKWMRMSGSIEAVQVNWMRRTNT